MSGKLDWSEHCSWGNQPPTHASLRPSSSEKLVACTEKQTDTHVHIQTHSRPQGDFLWRGGSFGRSGVLPPLQQTNFPGRLHSSGVATGLYIYLYIDVCVCVFVCTRLKSNDEHHPDRDLGRTELSSNWNCHIHSKCLQWKLPLAHNKNHLALNSLFWQHRR